MLRILYAFVFISVCIVRVDAAVVASSHLTISSFFVEATPAGNLNPGPPDTVLKQSVTAASDHDEFSGLSNASTINASDGGTTSQAYANYDETPVINSPGGTFDTNADARVNAGSLEPAEATSALAFTFPFSVVNGPTQYDISFQGDLLMTLDSDGDPADLYAFATSAFTIELIGTASGESIDLGDLASDSSSLTHTLELTGAGEQSYSRTGLLVAGTVNLNPGSYAINVSQANEAGVAAVPEPTTLAGLAILSAAGLCGSLWRRRGSTAVV